MATVGHGAPAPQDPEPVAILRDDRTPADESGNYAFDFETEDGVHRAETGIADDDGNVVITGEYS